MKRICSIFLIALIAFNTIGYYALFIIVKREFATPILQKIEANSNELGGNLIFVIPLALPYTHLEEGYTPITGEIVYEGSVYQLVKQRIYRDKVYVVCIKDDATTKARGMIADYSKLFSGQQADHADSTIKIINSISKFYTQEIHLPKVGNDGWWLELNPRPFSESYYFNHLTSVFHPPQTFI